MLAVGAVVGEVVGATNAVGRSRPVSDVEVGVRVKVDVLVGVRDGGIGVIVAVGVTVGVVCR